MVDLEKGSALPLRTLVHLGINERARSVIEEDDIGPDQISEALLEASRLTIDADELLRPLAERLKESPMGPTIESTLKGMSRLAISGRIAESEGLHTEVVELTAASQPVLSAPTKPVESPTLVESPQPIESPQPSSDILEAAASVHIETKVEKPAKLAHGERLGLFLARASELDENGQPIHDFDSLVRATFADKLGPLEVGSAAYKARFDKVRSYIRDIIDRLISIESDTARRPMQKTLDALGEFRSKPGLGALKGEELKLFLLREKAVTDEQPEQSEQLKQTVTPAAEAETPIVDPELKRLLVKDRVMIYLDHAAKVNDDGTPIGSFPEVVEKAFSDLLDPHRGDPKAYDKALKGCKANAISMISRLVNRMHVTGEELERLKGETRVGIARLKSDPSFVGLKGEELKDFLFRRVIIHQILKPNASPTIPEDKPKADEVVQEVVPTSEVKRTVRDLTRPELETALGFLRISPDRKTTIARGSATTLARMLQEEDSGRGSDGKVRYSSLNSRQASIYKERKAIEIILKETVESGSSKSGFDNNLKLLLETLKEEPEYKGLTLNQIIDLMFNRVSVAEVQRQNQNPAKVISAVGLPVVEQRPGVRSGEALLEKWELTEDEFEITQAALEWDKKRSERKYKSIEDLVVVIMEKTLEQETDFDRRKEMFEKGVEFIRDALRKASEKVEWGRGQNRAGGQLPPRLKELIAYVDSVKDDKGKGVYEYIGNSRLARTIRFEV